MNKGKKIFLIFLFVLLDISLIVGFLMIRDATMVNDLKIEIKELSKLDITKDRYNRKIKTSGNYAVVEKSIKNYLDQYALSLQDVLLVIKDSTLTQILSYDNYSQDGPEFQISLSYLKDTKDKFNSKMDELLQQLEETTIHDYINDKIDNNYYRNLYVELMLSDSMKDDFVETKELLSRTKARVNMVLDVSTNILNFLVIHKEDWKLEEGEIRFRTEELYNMYAEAISQLT